MKIFLLLLLSTPAIAASVNPLKLPVWSDSEKYQSKVVQIVPMLNRHYIAFAGLNYGAKNGLGVDAMACRKLSRYLCAGARIFAGSLNSNGIVRSPTLGEESTLPPNTPKTSEYQTILANPQSWFAFVPEVGFAVHTQIIPLAEDLWSESAWFGIGKSFIGGRSGWAFSFEPGINKKISADSSFGWTFRAKYTFGWLYAKDDNPGTIPYDWFNVTGGIFYLW